MLRSKGLTPRCKCSNYQTLSSPVLFALLFSSFLSVSSPAHRFLKAKPTCQSDPIRICKAWILGRFERHSIPDTCLQYPAQIFTVIFFWCYFDVAWSLQLEDGRIANERFRDVEVVPLERIFQTCTFCSSPCTGSTDNVLCNMKCNMISCSSFMTVRGMLHLFLR